MARFHEHIMTVSSQ
jgi:hypothetical protein